jgi:peptidoglycan/LPS O-acetylase OafA/YrhL
LKADAALASIQETTGTAGAATHATEFEALATNSDTYAKRWLAFTLVLGFVTLVTVVILVLKDPSGEKPSQIAQYVMVRVAAFALGSYLTVWAARNYRAHRHLQVTNKHRATALRTFQTFVAAASSDAPTKNAVLLEATRSIFTAGATGYSGDEPAGPTDRVVEIARTIVEKR